eukprot:3762648-Pleurochrysis_carterae.AAC.1
MAAALNNSPTKRRLRSILILYRSEALRSAPLCRCLCCDAGTAGHGYRTCCGHIAVAILLVRAS